MCPKEKLDPAQHLPQRDVRIGGSRDPGLIVVQGKASKTDPFRKGISVYLGRTGQSIHSVAAGIRCSGEQEKDHSSNLRMGIH